jgi:hypothetical protein
MTSIVIAIALTILLALNVWWLLDGQPATTISAQVRWGVQHSTAIPYALTCLLGHWSDVPGVRPPGGAWAALAIGALLLGLDLISRGDLAARTSVTCWLALGWAAGVTLWSMHGRVPA